MILSGCEFTERELLERGSAVVLLGTTFVMILSALADSITQ